MPTNDTQLSHSTDVAAALEGQPPHPLRASARGMKGRRRLGGESRSQKTLTSPAPSGPVTWTGSLRGLVLLRLVLRLLLAASFAALSKACGARAYTSRQYSNSVTRYYRDRRLIPGRLVPARAQASPGHAVTGRRRCGCVSRDGGTGGAVCAGAVTWEVPSPARPGCVRRA